MNKKKKYGQFFTNPIIADFMTRIAVSEKTVDFLDPAVGEGIFIEYANIINSKMNIDVYEIDPHMIKLYNKKIKFKTNIINDDYLYSDKKKYDSIVCNPPYNKFQEIPNRKELIKIFENKFNVRLSGYTNYYMYFLVKCINSLKENGKCVFIVPYEFMNCGYGEIIKKYLLEKRTLKSLIKFNNDLKLFSDAITTSCILVFENNVQNSVDFIEVCDIAELNYILKADFSSIKHFVYDYEDLKFDEKWSKYFENKTIGYNNLIIFNQFAQVKRGIATGNNKYFTLNKEDIDTNLLSNKVCIPCVSKSPDITELIVSDEYFCRLVNDNKKMFVFDGRNKTTVNDELYIKYGENIGVHKSYLNIHRIPWYGIEDKKPAPIWISVFNRGKLKVIRNEILINNLTTFHGIYLHEKYEEFTNILFCYLQTPIAQKILKINKREYGEGLNKFEPNDINNAYILDLSIINKDDLNRIQKIYDDYKKTKQMNIDLLNNIFLKYIEN